MRFTVIPALYLIVQFAVSALLEADDRVPSQAALPTMDESYFPLDASVLTTGAGFGAALPGHRTN